MTEFKDLIEKRKALEALEEWRKQPKHLYYDKGIEEIKFNDGTVHRTTISSGKTSIHPTPLRRRTLIDKIFHRDISGELSIKTRT